MNDIIKTKSETAKGSCIISKDVIATIACSAALEVEGVSSMAQRPTNLRELMNSAAKPCRFISTHPRIQQGGHDLCSVCCVP